MKPLVERIKTTLGERRNIWGQFVTGKFQDEIPRQPAMTYRKRA